MAKKKGKKKKTKEEVEKERLVEEQALQQEIEAEARREKEAAQKEEERLREIEKLRAAERKSEINRLDEEMGKFASGLESRRAEYRRVLASAKKHNEWERYLACSLIPDPNNEHELTSFLMKWSEGEDASLQSLSVLWQETGKLIEVLEENLAAALETGVDRKSAMLLEYHNRAHQLIIDKVDLATAYLLTHLDEQQRTKKKKQDFVCVVGNPDEATRMGMWINIGTAGFRAHPVNFEDENGSIGCHVVVPKALVLAAIAFRVIIQTNKHIIHEPRRCSSKEVILRDAARLFEEWKASMSKTCDEYVRVVGGEKCDLLTQQFDELSAELRQHYTNDAEEAAKWKSLVENPPLSSVVGGVISLDLLKIPPVCQKVKSWKMRPVGFFSKNVEKCTYPLQGTPSSQVIQPIQVTVTLPRNTIFPKDIVVGRWNKEEQDWNTDGILDIQFKEETSSISFSTMHIGHLAVIHPRSSNLPITEWSLKPKELGVILFEMEAGQFSVKIQITQKGCRLLQPDRPELSRILNRPMGARYLLANMARCNLDLNFRDGDAKAAELECRDRGIEKELHLDLSQVSSGFEVSSSHWNRARPATECLFKIREASEGATTNGPSVGEDTGNDWWSVGCNKDTGTRRGVKYSLLDLKEDALEFHAKNMQGEITHATLQNCLSDEKCSATALAVVANSDIMVQSHVRNLLDAIRPFSFA